MPNKDYISNITRIFPDINSILEIQCGNSYETENYPTLKNFSYIGIDVRDEVIADNRQYFRDDKSKIFIALDASNEPLPKADLVICNNMAEYLPIANIWSLLENIRDSGAKYFTFNYCHNNQTNDEIILPKDPIEIKSPQKRTLNLSVAPFYLPQPEFLFTTDDVANSIALYKIADVGFYMEWHNDDVSKLRVELVKKLTAAMDFLKTSFDREPNGAALFREMMVEFLNIDSGAHNQKYYFAESYKKIIDGIGGLNTRNNIYRLAYKAELNLLQQEGYDFVTEENFAQAQIITKDYIRWVFGLDLRID